MTAQLSWDVQNCDLIKSLVSRQEHYSFTQDLDYELIEHLSDKSLQFPWDQPSILSWHTQLQIRLDCPNRDWGHTAWYVRYYTSVMISYYKIVSAMMKYYTRSMISYYKTVSAVCSWYVALEEMKVGPMKFHAPHQWFNTLRPRQMDAISQTTFSIPFSWKKMSEFQLKFHWSLFLRVQSTII